MSKLKKLSMIAAITAGIMFATSVAFAASVKDFVLLKGGSKPAAAKVSQVKDGIKITGKGSYTPDGEAAGVILKKAVSPKNVTVEFTVDKIPTLNPIKGGQWSQDRDSWYAVSIMDKSKFWTTSNDQVKSFTLAISPISNNRAYVHLFRTFAGGFSQMNWLATIPCKAGSKMAVNIKWVDKNVKATINGTKIPLDDFNVDQLETIDPVFGKQVYVGVSCQTGANEAAMTLKKINTTSFAMPAKKK